MIAVGLFVAALLTPQTASTTLAEARRLINAGQPSPVNDLSFLTGPVGRRRERAARARRSWAAPRRSTCTGSPQTGAPLPGFPKLTADWTVANPALGSFGTFDVEASARKALVGLTRTGTLLAYDTDAPSCSPGSWPRFHHDNANSGDYSRDARAARQAVRHRARRQQQHHLQGARRRPHVRHRRSLRGREVQRHDHGVQLREPGAGHRCARADRARHHADHADPAGAPPVRRRARGGRAGQRGAARGHGDPELRPAEGRDAGARVARAGVRRVHVAQPLARPAARPPVVRSAAAGLLAADARCPGRERQAGAVDRIGAPAASSPATRGRLPSTRRTCASRSRSPTCASAATCPTTRASSSCRRSCGSPTATTGRRRASRPPRRTLRSR